MLNEELKENMESLSVTSYLVKNRTFLIQKYPAKVNAIGYYQPITYLNPLWKLKTDIIADIIADKLCQYLENEKLLLEEQKICWHAFRDTKEQLLVDKAVIKNCKKRKRNLNMAWADFRNACGIFPHTWMIKT